MKNGKVAFLTIYTLVLVAALSCGGNGLSRPNSTPTPAVVLSEADVEVATNVAPIVEPSPAPILTPQEDEAIDIMWRVLDRYGSANKRAVAEAGRNGHLGLVPVLVEAASRTYEPGLALDISRALEKITGDSIGGDFVLGGPWFSWMSRQDPPLPTLEGFDEWKGELPATIDPSFKTFIYGDVPSRIPPLELPDVVPGNEVDYLNLDEPIF
jgi:hypothetical protein